MKEFLGKITSAEFGVKTIDNKEYIGLELKANTKQNSDIFTKKFYYDIGWGEDTFMEASMSVYDILKSAKVNSVSELVGEPVEIVIDDKSSEMDFNFLAEDYD